MIRIFMPLICRTTPPAIFARRLDHARIAALTATGPAAYVINGLLSVSVVSLANQLALPGPSLTVWLLLQLVVLSIRWNGQVVLSAHGFGTRMPEKALVMIGVGALVSGLLWASLPLFLPGFDPLGTHAAISLVMAAVGMAAMTRTVACSSVSLAFGLPSLLALVVALALQAGPSSRVLALEMLALTLLAARSCLMSGKTFARLQLQAFEAKQATLALRKADAARRRHLERLERLASFDALTGLANRTRFTERLDSALGRCVGGGSVSVLLIDLDHFRSVNNLLGHATGDALLVPFARELERTIGNRGVAARIGGDDFAVFVEGEASALRALTLAEEILDRSSRPFCLNGGEVMLRCSIGLATVPDHATTATGVMAAADLALQQAKAHGRRCLQLFDPALSREEARRRQIERDLETAIETGAITAHFQPQVNLATRRLVGLEALMRWTHPDLGPVPPTEIIAAGQALHLSDRLTCLMTEAACRALVALDAAGRPDVTVAVNVSPREISSYSVADAIAPIVARHGIDPTRLEIEFTEEALMETHLIGAELKKLETAGYHLTVDDFGMGHTSLAYLLDIRIDRLKIDRSFVVGIDTSRHHQALVTAVTGLGRTLDIDIIVEGVETEDDAAILSTLGCSVAQGYHFARPMPFDQLLHWMVGQPAVTVAA